MPPKKRARIVRSDDESSAEESDDNVQRPVPPSKKSKKKQKEVDASSEEDAATDDIPVHLRPKLVGIKFADLAPELQKERNEYLQRRRRDRAAEKASRGLTEKQSARLQADLTPSGLPTATEGNIVGGPGSALTPAAQGMMLNHMAQRHQLDYTNVLLREISVSLHSLAISFAAVNAGVAPVPPIPQTLQGYTPGEAELRLEGIHVGIVKAKPVTYTRSKTAQRQQRDQEEPDDDEEGDDHPPARAPLADVSNLPKAPAPVKFAHQPWPARAQAPQPAYQYETPQGAVPPTNMLGPWAMSSSTRSSHFAAVSEAGPSTQPVNNHGNTYSAPGGLSATGQYGRLHRS